MMALLQEAQPQNPLELSFKHKGLQKFFETGSIAGIQPIHRKKLRMRLAALDTATTIQEMALPGFRLHPLKGDKQGSWAIECEQKLAYHFSIH